MKVTKREPSVLPIYLIGLVWVFAAFVVGLHSFFGYLGAAAFSAAAYLAAKQLFPDKVYEQEVPDPEPSDPELAALKQQRSHALSEMRRLNDNIQDQEISRAIEHIELVTGKIFDHVMEFPEKKPLVRRFMDYYLPTTLKLLGQYDRMDQLGVSGQNIAASQERIRRMLSTVSAAFDKQLDSLFQDDYMDISADISVMEQLLNQEGLTGGM